MADCGCDADKITRWVIKRCYRISKPSPDQIARYRYWHAVSRGPGGFTASGPFECWLSREIPPDTVVRRPPKPELPRPDPPKNDLDKMAGSFSEPASSPERVRVRERAQALVRAELASGPKHRELVKAAAVAAKISERNLIAAAERLGVCIQRGHWRLPG